MPQRTEVLLVKGDAAVALRDGGQGPVQSPADAAPQLAVCMTPHGFIQKAMQSGPTMKEMQHNGITYKAVTFVWERFPVTGYIGPDNFLRRVETRVPNPLYGDMKVAVSFHEYKDFNGIQFPSRILEKQADFPALEIDVDMVETGVEVATELPERAAPPFPRGPELPNQKVADGVWLIQGGPHNSVAVEFDDFVTIVEAPLGEWLSMGVINTVKKLIPGKPIRYLVNTHHHFDHAAGFRTYAAEGATIVTHKQNLAFYEELLEAPRELSADRLSESGKDVNFETLTCYHEISDCDRTIALHLIAGDPHSDGMIMAYLAEEKILIEADVYNPGIPIMQADAPPHPFSVNLYRIMRTLGLDVEKIIPIHGPVATIGDLKAHVNAE